ncbi:N-acetyltransferase [Vibrio kasasachensis]|uniref:GNAT family N-acetyltransferase n=1 Tax=Vibrio kasasachensis TaxID=2910248 RepID=UPI003D12E888
MYTVTFDQVKREFRVTLARELFAVVEFERQGNVFVITSTKVPESLQGMGYGKVMMERVLPEIEKMDGRVLAKCSYVVAYLEKNPQWQHLRVYTRHT